MEYTIHTVQPEDSFNRMATRYNTTIEEILNTHNQIATTNVPLSRDSRIHSGDKIYIPIKNKTPSNHAYVILDITEEQRALSTTEAYYGTTRAAMNEFNKKKLPAPMNPGYGKVYIPIKSYSTITQPVNNTQSEVKTNNKQKANEASSEQDNRPVNSCTTVTACTEDQFIIQVMGKDHPAEQRIILLDENNTEISPDAKEVIEETDQTLLSTLHGWDWEKLKNKKDKLKAYLQIETTKGEPIRLLLSKRINKTTKELDKQHNQIVPIIPITTIERIIKQNSIASYYEAPVTARTGYLYIFKSDLLIRELKIQENNQRLSYKDIPLEQYRKLSFFEEGYREATGAELSEIWLASSWNKTDTTDISLIYSEVQLSGARLNLFTTDKQTFNKHPKTYLNTLSVDAVTDKKRNTAVSYQTILKSADVYRNTAVENMLANIKNGVVQAATLPSQRARNTLLESALDNPAAYLYDREYKEIAYNLVRRFQRTVEEGSLDFFDIPKNGEITAYGSRLKVSDLEYMAWQEIIDENVEAAKKQLISKIYGAATTLVYTVQNSILNTTNPNPENQGQIRFSVEQPVQPSFFSIIQNLKTPLNDAFQEMLNIAKDHNQQTQAGKNIWSNIPEYTNILADAQNRKIYCVYVEDQFFRNRQLVTNIGNTVIQIQKVTTAASKETYFDSALIVQRIIMPKKIGGKENQLRKDNIGYISDEGHKKLAIASASIARAALITKYSTIQKELLQQYQAENFREILADHLSQDNRVHYAAAYLNTLVSLVSFAIPIEQIDPYLGDDKKIYYGENRLIGEADENSRQVLSYLTHIAQSINDPLHKMLYKPLNLERISDYLNRDELTKKTPNTGKGYLRADLLQQCLNEQKKYTDQDQDNLSAALLIAQYEGTSILPDAVNFFKDLLGQIAGASGNLKAIVEAGASKLKKEQENNENLKAQIAKIERAQQELEEKSKRIEAIRQEIAELNEQQIINEKISIAEQENQQTNEVIKANNARLEELNKNLEALNAELDQQAQTNQAKQTEQQTLEHQQTEQNAKIRQLETEIQQLKQQQQQQKQQQQDQQRIAKIEQDIHNKQAELARLKQNSASSAMSNRGNQLIKDALNNTSNNGQARAGTIKLYGELEIWRAVFFDSERHILGGMLADARIAKFTQRVQGTRDTSKGILIRFSRAPSVKAKTLLKRLYGEVEVDGSTVGSTNKNNINVETSLEGLGVFAKENSDLYKFVEALEEEAARAHDKNFSEATDQQRKEIAEKYKADAEAQKAQVEAETKRLQAEIKKLEADKKALTSKVNETIHQHGEMQELGVSAEELAKKTAALEKAKNNANNTASQIDALKNDIRLLESYQQGLETKISIEQQTIDEINKNTTAANTTIDKNNQTIESERTRLASERASNLEEAQTRLDQAIEEHKELANKQNNINYDELRQNLITSDNDIAEAQQRQTKARGQQAKLDRFADTHVFRGAVLGFQVWSFYNMMKNFKNMLEGDRVGYTFTTVITGGLNVAMAAEDMIANIFKNSMSTLIRQKVLFQIPESFIPNILRFSNSVVITAKVTSLMLAQTVLGLAAVGLSLADLCYSIYEGEKMSIIAAKGLAVIGAVMGLAAVFISGPVAGLLLNPLGLAAIIVSVVAFALIWYFSTTAIEDWLKQGPFSSAPSYHLQDQTEAFYRLVGIFADIQIKISKNPEVKMSTIEKAQIIDKGRTFNVFKRKQATLIEITSQLSSLMSIGSEAIKYRFFFSVRSKNFGDDEITNKIVKLLSYNEKDIPNGKAYIVDEVDRFENAKGIVKSSSFDWLVEAQIVVQYNGKSLAFPALAPDDESHSYDAASLPKYQEPSFSRSGWSKAKQPFWANEETHLAKDNLTNSTK